MCEVIFPNKIQGTEHYIRHSIDMETLYREGNENRTEQLDGIFEKLADIRKEILDHIFSNGEESNEETFMGEESQNF